MATFLTLVNDLQVRLRETQTAAVTTNTYSTLLGSFVNQAKRDVEAAWDWHCLRTVLSVTTSNGTASYDITGSNERSRFFSPSKEIYDDTNDGIILPAPDWFIDQQTYLGTTQTGQPIYYRIRGISAAGLLQITFYPTPAGTYVIRLPMVVPQATLTGTTTITVPSAPVFEKAVYYALNERGEDGGTSAREQAEVARQVLFDAVESDRSFNPDEGFAEVV